jgi:hypothetical protein
MCVDVPGSTTTITHTSTPNLPTKPNNQSIILCKEKINLNKQTNFPTDPETTTHRYLAIE